MTSNITWDVEARNKMVEAKIAIEWYLGHEETDAYGNKYRVGGELNRLLSIAQKLRERSDLGARFLDRTFDNFDRTLDPHAYQKAIGYAHDDNLFKNKKNGLIILGNVGSGKTHLAAAIANDFVDRGIKALFGTFQTHLENIKSEFERTGRNRELAKIKAVSILVIDDLGKEHKSEWTQSILYDIVNYRYEHLLPTIITTNFNDTELANYCEHAVWSRLGEMCSGIKMSGGDYRERK